MKLPYPIYLPEGNYRVVILEKGKIGYEVLGGYDAVGDKRWEPTTPNVEILSRAVVEFALQDLPARVKHPFHYGQNYNLRLVVCRREDGQYDLHLEESFGNDLLGAQRWCTVAPTVERLESALLALALV